MNSLSVRHLAVKMTIKIYCFLCSKRPVYAVFCLRRYPDEEKYVGCRYVSHWASIKIPLEIRGLLVSYIYSMAASFFQTLLSGGFIDKTVILSVFGLASPFFFGGNSHT